MKPEPKKVKVFSNTKRTNNDPDLTGFVSVGENKIQRISLWLNKSKTGEQYYSGYLNDIDTNAAK
jgi:hypothetical protein